MPTLIESTCAHCTLPVPPGDVRAGDADQFCCPGCRAVFEQIHACGLEDYYRYRDAGELTPQAALVAVADHAAFDTPAYAELYVRDEGTQARTEFVLEGVTCAACVWLVERLPLRVPGLIDAQLSLADNTLRLRWDTTRVRLSRIAAELTRFGYRPHPARAVKQADLFRAELRRRLIDLGVAGAIAGNLMLLSAGLYAGWTQGMEASYEQMLRWFSLLLGVLALAWPGRVFFKGALVAVRLRTVNFDLPIAAALAAGGVAGVANVARGRGEIYFDSLAALIFLLLIGRLVQFCQQRRARSAVELLFSLTPSTCRVLNGGEARTVPIQTIQTGDVVEVRAEELFPADGVVRRGVSSVDTALLTGESRPVVVGVGQSVYAGARNVDTPLHVEVTAAGEQTRVGRLMRLIEHGLSEKPPIVQTTDRIAGRFTVGVLVAAALTFAAWLPRGVESASEIVVALLVVTCPCVLGLAVPMAFAMSTGRLARRGILVKSASALERLARGGRVVFDKTGTLTTGRMRVAAWVGDESWQGVVSEMERDATHPAGRALRSAYEHCEAPAEWRGRHAAVRTQTGGGLIAAFGATTVFVGSPRMMTEAGLHVPAELEAARVAFESSGHTIVLVGNGDGDGDGGVVRAVIALEDAVRDEAAGVVAGLRRRGFEPIVCSGDVQGAVDRAARALSIAPVYARGGVSPEEKVNTVRQAGAVMVGDGVNDAAALAAADVGIAVAGGAEAALAAADVYIAGPSLAALVELIDTARHTLWIVRRNVVIATLYNVLAGALAAAGMMHPLMAACLMPLSSVTVLSLTVLAARRGPKVSVS